MANLALTPHFNKDLDALKRNHPVNFRKAASILIELQRGEQVPADFRPDGRIPNCVKYGLSDGFRIVMQRVDGADTLIALAVGTHEHVDYFLDGHRGYVFDPVSGRLRELRLATSLDSAVPVVAGTQAPTDPKDGVLKIASTAGSGSGAEGAAEPVFVGITAAQLIRIGVPEPLGYKLLAQTDANSVEFMLLLQEVGDVNQDAGDLLLSFATGNPETRATVSKVLDGQSEFRRALSGEDIGALQSSPEEFVTFEDVVDLEELLDKSTFEQWQVFLHPAQKSLVERRFDGPARLRGISGSGKTVVALHRARRLARLYAGSDKVVLFTTFNKALAQAASRLLDSMCGPERDRIEVTHLHRWCHQYLDFNDVARPQFLPDAARQANARVFPKLTAEDRQQLETLSRDYIQSEVDFIYGRFLHDEADQYIDTDRSGRGRGLTKRQREAILRFYRLYFDELLGLKCVDAAEVVRAAYRLSLAGRPAQKNYGSVIVDEVQDLSELSLRLLHRIVGSKVDGLLLAGDSTQRIFTRGFSMTNLGIDITGRSVVLRKNYRNTRQILEGAFPLVVGEWESEAKAAGLDSRELKPEFSERDGPRPMIVTCLDVPSELWFVAREVKFLLQFDRYQPKDICVMARNKDYRKRVLEALISSGIPARDYEPQSGEDNNAVRVSTVHNSKGHEYAAVFICGMVEGVFPPPSRPDDSDVSAERALLYVGMTRARDIVYLSLSETEAGGRVLKPSALLTGIGPTCDWYEFRR